MGKQTNLYFVGTRHNLVYYQLNGGYYVRTKPVVVRQTPATRTCAGHFKTAVKTSKALRDSLAPLLLPQSKRQTAIRLNTALYQWLLQRPLNATACLQTVAPLQDFQFSAKTSLKEKWKTSLQVQWQKEGEVLITIPALTLVRDIVAPAHTQYITLCVALVSCSLDDYSITARQTATITLPYSDTPVAAQQISLPRSTATGSLTIVAASLRYQLHQQDAIHKSREEDWQPTAIISALWQAGAIENTASY